MSESTARFTTLLPNDVLARLERMRLNPMRQKTNHSRGEHLARKGGTSTEFADYRDYVPGDDVRYVDWNIFARTNHPFLKLYRQEEEMHVVVLLDASTSMSFEGKFALARQLAAAFSILALMNVEKLSVYSCSDRSRDPLILSPCRGRTSLRRVLQFLEDLAEGGEYPIEVAIQEALSRHRGRGVAVVLSDFLTLGEMTRSFNLLNSAGLEVCAVQILGPTERDPELTGDLRFVDAETEQTLDVSSVGELLGVYHEHRAALESHLAGLCRQRQGRFLSVSAEASIESVLFDQMLRQGWIR